MSVSLNQQKVLLAIVLSALIMFLLVPSSSFAATNYLKKMNIKFKGIKTSQKAVVKQYISEGSPTVQKYAARLNGSFTISTKKNAALSFASFKWNGVSKPKYKIVYSREHIIANNPYSKFLIWHEIGHLIQYSGLTQKAEKKFRTLIKKSPNYKKCFPLSGKCVAIEEIFADQIAFLATGDPALRSGYNIPPLTTTKSMTSFLKKYHKIRGNQPAYLIK